MLKEIQHIIVLLKRLAILLLLFSICRVIFYFFNSELFPEITGENIFWIIIYGVRYDVSAIIILNSLFIILHLIPSPYWGTRTYQSILKILFYTVNTIAFLFEASDFAYFKYSFKRITSDIVFMTHDAPTLMPAFIRDFWYLLILIAALFLFAEFLYRKTYKGNFQMSFLKSGFRKNIFSLLAAAFLLIAARGGIQSINPESADAHLPVALDALAQNTSFTLLYSLKHKRIEEKNFFSQEELGKHFTTQQSFEGKPACVYNPQKKKLNVVVLIMESFSREYSGYLNGHDGFMPFLDSLMQQGMIFTNAWANGKKSIEGIPAVLSSIPGLINDPLLNYTGYPDLKMNSLASYLKQVGYSTAFYHGASNGSMNFDRYALASGFDSYFGKNEYPNLNDDDKVWGIFDEPFLQFTAGKLNKMPQPFLGAFFSLTSHHPFTIPSQYKGKFKQGNEPIEEVIQYTDYSLKKFFETVSKQEWFANTLFVITADHTGPTSDEYYKTRSGMYRIPILLFQPGNNLLRGRRDEVVQQTDILPTILDFLGYEKNFLAFGSSAFDVAEPRYAVNFLGGIYQITDGHYSLLHDGEHAIELYDLLRDPLMKKNIIDEAIDVRERLSKQLEAEIQVFNSSVIQNRLAQ